MKKRMEALLLAFALLLASFMAGCAQDGGGKNGTEQPTEGPQTQEEDASAMMEANAGELQVIDDKYRTYYEVFVYSFADSDGDGVGDLRGLIDNLDYINDGDDTTDSDLGCNGIWLMPIMPSTTYHKYDVTDYEAIDPEYGSMEDFDELIAACHERGIRVIIDFVMNHTSSQHPWFTEACRYLEGLPEGATPDPNECPYVDYYNFSEKKESGVYYQAGSSNWYYEGKFWDGMPDLNLANGAVRQEFDNITTFWMDKGVDGFRLDAAKEYYSDQTSANVEVLTWFNTMVKEKDPDSYIVAEVWTDRDTYAKYYESGIDSVFNFDFANQEGIIANAVKGTSSSGAQGYANVASSLSELFGAYSDTYIDAPFYTNHDLGRSAGYYSGDYSEAQTKIAGAMNLMMTGNCFVYYGEELGMKGAGKDENKRAPMQWSSDPNQAGMCDGPQYMDDVKMKYGSLEEQRDNPMSVYNYFKQAIRLRNRYPEIARGEVENLTDISNENIAAMRKSYEGSELLLLFNISQEEQKVDISAVELSGKSLKDSGSIGGMLLTDSEAVSMENGIVTMPAYSVTILKVE